MSRKLSPLLALAAGCSWLDPMRDQPKAPPYAYSAFFPDGSAMRAPPEGTVPRGRPQGDAAFLTGRGPDGQPVATLPLPLSRALIEEGRARFEVLCAACHGLDGQANTPVAAAMSLRPPPSLMMHIGHPPGHFYQAIAEGFGMMPSFAAQLSPRERWAVVAYVLALQLSQRAPLEAAPEPTRRGLLREGG